MTLDELVNATIVCGDPVLVMGFDADDNEVVYFNDFTDELSDSDFDENEDVLEYEVTYIEARKINNKTTLQITISER